MREYELIKEYGIENVLENVKVLDITFYIVIVHENGIMLFSKDIDDFKINEAIRELCMKLSLSREKLIVIQNRREEYFYLYATGSKEPTKIEESFNYLVNERLKTFENDGLDGIDRDINVGENGISYIMSDLKSLDCKTANARVKEYEDGTVMVKTSAGWEIAAPNDTLEEFKSNLFFGFLGINKFKTHKIWEGIMYVLTGGLFCFGYIEDLLPFLCDTKRDADGRPYIPIDREIKKQFLFPFVLMVLLNIIYCYILFFVLRNF